MDKENELPCWAALGIIGLLVLIAIFAMNYPKNSTEWAAWVQAFGSIGAICAAIYIMEKGRKHQESVRRQREEEVIRSAAKSIITVLSTIYNIENSLKESWRLGSGSIPLDMIVRLPLETAKRLTDQIPWYSPPYTKILPMADALQGLEVALCYYSTREFPNDSITNESDYRKALGKAESLKALAKSTMDEYAEVAGIDFNS